jgi:hypothetical protein
MTRRLLDAFGALFEGRAYIHRASNLGDRIAVEVYEDLHALARSAKFLASVNSAQRGVGPRNKAVTLQRMRRGDGTLGELLDPASARRIPGYAVARGAVATIDCAVEVKILNKAMIKQIDRVLNDIEKQATNWKRVSPAVVSLAVIGINRAPHTVGYEGERAYRTDGTKHKHPIQEADAAEQRIVQRSVGSGLYDDVLILRYSATNEPPFPFAWVDEAATAQAYRAILIRLSKAIQDRF